MRAGFRPNYQAGTHLRAQHGISTLPHRQCRFANRQDPHRPCQRRRVQCLLHGKRGVGETQRLRRQRLQQRGGAAGGRSALKA